MANRLSMTLDNIAREQEAPMYALERLRLAVVEDVIIADRDAKRLEALDKSGEGRAFGAGWVAFFVFAKAHCHRKGSK